MEKCVKYSHFVTLKTVFCFAFGLGSSSSTKFQTLKIFLKNNQATTLY